VVYDINGTSVETVREIERSKKKGKRRRKVLCFNKKGRSKAK